MGNTDINRLTDKTLIKPIEPEMTCDSHRRRQTSGRKPNGDCSFGSLAAADDFLWANIHEFCQVSHKFLVRFSPLIFVSISFAMFPHVFMLFLPHLFLLFRCHLLFMILELILCIVFFHDFRNVFATGLTL